MSQIKVQYYKENKIGKGLLYEVKALEETHSRGLKSRS